MIPLSHVRVAFLNLKANKVRSILSMLGIVIGTGAVIVVTSVVNGIRKATLESMMMGSTDMLRLRPTYSKTSRRFGKITFEDIERIKKIPKVKTAMPELSTQKEVKGSLGKVKANLTGINEEYFDIYQYKVIDGKGITDEDVRTRRRVCLVNENFIKKLFGIEYPIGQKIRSEEFPLRIIGIFKEPDNMAHRFQKAEIVLPVSTLFRMIGERSITSVEIRSQPGKIDLVKQKLDELIKSNPRQSDLLELEDPRQMLKEMDKWARVWMIQLILIAGISLLVGGIGLMNVMLTTVAERTREIGLRKALGASSRIIQVQFLVESATLSGIGGLTGVGIGFFISKGIDILSSGKLFIAILPISLTGSFLFAVILGVVFGLYPASKAAHLSPVEALRYE